MFDIGFQELLVIGVIALLVFGPQKLPELGRMFGRAMREFRRASDEFRATVETNLHINEPDPFPQPSVTPVAEETLVAEPVGALSAASDVAPAALDPAPTVAAEGGVTDPLASESGEPFCAQRGSRLFHRRECVWLGRIPEVDRIYLKRASDARDQGLLPCPVCDPWEPA